MKKQELSEKFIELRAKDTSISKIAQELDISRQTATTWSKEFRHEILNSKALRLEGLKEAYALTMEAKVKRLGEMANNIEQELLTRDMVNVSTEKLLDMLLKLEGRLQEIYEDPVVKTDKEIKEAKALSESMKMPLMMPFPDNN